MVVPNRLLDAWMDRPAKPRVRPDPNDPGRPVRGISDHDLINRESIFRPDLLAGKRILVTGGGSGMGKATAILAARLGADRKSVV